MQKIVLDYSVLKKAPEIIMAIKDAEIYIPWCSMEELDLFEPEREEGVPGLLEGIDALMAAPSPVIDLNNGSTVQIDTDLNDTVYDVAKRHQASIMSDNHLTRIHAKALNVPVVPEVHPTEADKKCWCDIVNLTKARYL